MLTKNQQIVKRLFDLSIAFVLFLFALIPLILLLVMASIDMGRNGLFVHRRIGYLGKSFKLYKIRTLKGSHHEDIVAIKANETKFGRFLRKTKLDELPQFFNVLKGEMSLVGPRPDMPGYADCLNEEDSIVLSVRPGVTGPATLKYRNEEVLLSKQENPKEYNDQIIWPDKVAINKEYIKNWSLQKDIYYLFASLVN